MEAVITIVVLVAVVYGLYRYIEHRKEKRAQRQTGTGSGGGRTEPGRTDPH